MLSYSEPSCAGASTLSAAQFLFPSVGIARVMRGFRVISASVFARCSAVPARKVQCSKVSPERHLRYEGCRPHTWCRIASLSTPPIQTLLQYSEENLPVQVSLLRGFQTMHVTVLKALENRGKTSVARNQNRTSQKSKTPLWNIILHIERRKRRAVWQHHKADAIRSGGVTHRDFLNSWFDFQNKWVKQFIRLHQSD